MISAPGTDLSLARRILVTVAALVLYRFGCLILLPGVELTGVDPGLFADSVTAMSRLSIFALGLYPYFFVLVCVETIKLLFPAVLLWEASRAANREQLALAVRGTTLVLAAVQAWAIAIALEEVGHLVPETGFFFRAGIVATVVGATALLIWLSDQISRRGIGHGFWLLWAVPTLAGMMLRAGQILALTDAGAITSVSIAAGAAWLIGVVIVVVLIAKARFGHSLLHHHAGALSLPDSLVRSPMAFDILPLFIATVLCDMLASATGLLPLPDQGFSLAGVLYFALLAGLIASFAFLRGRADLALARQRGEMPDNHAMVRQASFTAAALIVISLTGKILFPLLPGVPALLVVILVAMNFVESIAAERPARLPHVPQNVR